MKNRMKGKVRSQTGASVTYALLLFLICAVVGSVVLTAGSAAAGRMSKIAESDQRYYSVNSAARLLIDQIEKETIRIKKTVSIDGSSDPVYAYFTVTETVNAEGQPEPTETPVDVSEGFKTIAMEAANRIARESGDLNKPIIYLMTPSFSEDKEFQVTATETIVPDGSILFDLRNTDAANNSYEIHVRFAAVKLEKRELNVEEQKEVITTDLSWKLSDVQPVWHKPEAASAGG